MIVDYLKNGKSWDKTQYKRWQGKRAVDKVLEIYMAQYKQPSQDEPNKQKIPSASGEDVNA